MSAKVSTMDEIRDSQAREVKFGMKIETPEAMAARLTARYAFGSRPVVEYVAAIIRADRAATAVALREEAELAWPTRAVLLAFAAELKGSPIGTKTG